MRLFRSLVLITFLIIWNLLLGHSARVSALYDPLSVPNNKVGVHILDPNEISQVPAIVNSQGGDWGYVTVPIQPSDRDQSKWQTFMQACRDQHLIPIIRITTIPLGGTWDRARDTDLVDFANFLAELAWPVQNRYIVLFNEVNRDQEWGGTVDPAAYTRIVKNAYSIFKERHRDFFLLGPALDSALPNSQTSLSAPSYLQAMQREDPAIWSYFDGWASHSYPNPGFLASPAKKGWQSVTSYRTETSAFQIVGKPVFITETGWDQDKLSSATLESYWRQAFNTWALDRSVVAVTPFVLQGGEQFRPLSLQSPGGELRPSGQAIMNLTKVAGQPPLSSDNGSIALPKSATSHTTEGLGLTFRPPLLALRIENFFRALFGLTKKSYLTVGSTDLTVEVADQANLWEKGLSGRSNLENGTGMLFVFPRAHVPVFWMKEMNFPLDLVWLKDGQILEVVENVPVPAGGSLPTFSPAAPVDMVLEVPAGYAQSQGWGPGTEVKLYD